MESNPSGKKWIVYVSTFPPRECGIATFTEDLTNSFDEMYNPREEAKIVAMNLDKTSLYPYDKKKVIFQISQPDEKSYIKAAQYLNNLNQVAIVNIQHEFGIFGGSYGSHLLVFLRELQKPVVITFHTVLPTPNKELHDIVFAINNHICGIIVMTESSKNILIKDYSIDPDKISVIPHGIHPVPFTDSKKAKHDLGYSKNITISTFGFLSRNKGIEYGIEAMANVVKKFPNAVYLIIGATHPVILKNEGEIYRNTLVKKVHNLNLENNIFFYNKYLDINELLHFLEATDIYLALPQDPNQAVSGTLSYALGSGKPVISTSFAQAREDVTGEVGILVDFKDVKQIETALQTLIADSEKRKNMAKNAYFRTRGRTWRNVILAYMKEYIRIVPSLGDVEKNIPRIKSSHIFELTDNFGMIQFAQLTVPDLSSGYTTDDNARALIAMVTYYEKFGKIRVLPLIETYLHFLLYVERKDGGFHNYVDGERKIPQDQHLKGNLETTGARVMFALAKTATSDNLPEAIREMASTLFNRNMHIGEKMTSLRSIAYFIKALVAWNTTHNTPEIQLSVERLSEILVDMYERNNSPDWRWFEDILAYSNALMPDALIDAYTLVKKEKYLSVARQALDFLIGYSFEEDVCVPVGQDGWMKRGQEKQRYDQQPEEAAVLVFALKAMYRITGEEKYNKMRRDAFNWFLGNNTLHQVIYSQATGGCYDGIGEKEINLNQGAESTVMYLLARLSFEE